MSPAATTASRAVSGPAILGERTIDTPLGRLETARLLPALATALTFGLLFVQPFLSLVRDWWTMPEAGHGLLLGPVAAWLAWKAGVRPGARGDVTVGVGLLFAAVALRCAAGLAAELFTMRVSMLMALAGITVYHYGIRQVVRWWLPFVLAGLSIPLPELVTQALALPLQFKASQMGASLLAMRNVPVLLTGNVIRLPGHELFVTEACSGLRSLTALISLAVLLGALVLRSPVSRVLLIALAIPIAVMINGVRVFLTGFLVYFVNPALGTGFMHSTEGWLLFLVSFATLSMIAWVAVQRNALSCLRRPMHKLHRYLPAVILALGCAFVLHTRSQAALRLVQPLATILGDVTGYSIKPQTVGAEERRVAGMSDYVARAYLRDSTVAFTTLVSYYERQTQGKTIHSPKNCLPGAGWEILNGGTTPIRVAGATHLVNRYVLKNGSAVAIAYYWYQGRGRVVASEYAVKWNLLRDAALLGHTEEALVRVVVPVTPTARETSDAAAPSYAVADSLGADIARRLIRDVARVLPPGTVAAAGTNTRLERLASAATSASP